MTSNSRFSFMHRNKGISYDFSIRDCVLTVWIHSIHEVDILQFSRFGFFLVSTLIGDDQTHCAVYYQKIYNKRTSLVTFPIQCKVFTCDCSFFVSSRYTKALYRLKLTTNKNCLASASSFASRRLEMRS